MIVGWTGQSFRCDEKYNSNIRNNHYQTVLRR
jgi:hypothetical protein